MPNFALRNGHCKSRMSLLWSIRLLVMLFFRELGLEFEWLSRNLVKSVSQSNVNTSWTKCFKKCQGYVCTCHPFTVQQNLMLMMTVPTADADVLRINAVFVFSVGWGELALLISSPACSSLSSFFTSELFVRERNQPLDLDLWPAQCCVWGSATSRCAEKQQPANHTARHTNTIRVLICSSCFARRDQGGVCRRHLR